MKFQQQPKTSKIGWLWGKVVGVFDRIIESQQFRVYYKLAFFIIFCTIEVLDIIIEIFVNDYELAKIKNEMIIFIILIFVSLIMIPLITYRIINLLFQEIIISCMLCGLFESFSQDQQKILRLCAFFSFSQRSIGDMKKLKVNNIAIIVLIFYAQIRFSMDKIHNISQIFQHFVLLIANFYFSFTKLPHHNSNNNNKQFKKTLTMDHNSMIKINQLNHQQSNQSSVFLNGLNINGIINNDVKNSKQSGADQSSLFEFTNNLYKKQNNSALNYDDHAYSSQFDVNKMNYIHGMKNGSHAIYSSKDIAKLDQKTISSKKPLSFQQIPLQNTQMNSEKLYYMWQSMNQVSIGIILLNQTKQVVYSNKQFKKIFTQSHSFINSHANNANSTNNTNNNFHQQNGINSQSNLHSHQAGSSSIMKQFLSSKVQLDYHYQNRQKENNNQGSDNNYEKDNLGNNGGEGTQHLKNNKFPLIQIQSKVDKILEEQRQSRELQRNHSPRSKQKQDQYGSVIYNQYQSSKNIQGGQTNGQTHQPARSNQLRKLTTVEVISSSDGKNESKVKEKNKHHTYVAQPNNNNHNLEYNSLRNIGFQQQSGLYSQVIPSFISQPRTSQFIPQSVLNNMSQNNINLQNAYNFSNLNNINANNTPNNITSNNTSNCRNSIRASTLLKHDRLIYNSIQNSHLFNQQEYHNKKIMQCTIPNNIKKLFKKEDLNIEDVINFLIMYSVSPQNQKLNTDNQILSEGSDENTTSLVSLKEHHKEYKKPSPRKNPIQFKIREELTQVEDNEEEGEDVYDDEEPNETVELDIDMNLREDRDRMTEKQTKGGRSTGRGGQQSTAVPGIDKDSVIVEPTTTMDNYTGKRTKSVSAKSRQNMYNYYVQNNQLHIQVELSEEQENKEESVQDTLLEIRLSVLVEIDDQMEEKLVLVEVQDITKLKKVIENENLDIYKNKILSSVSHELRTPLNCSIQMLDMLSQNEDIPDMLKQIFVMPALNSNYLLLNIINDILDLAQINYGKFTMLFSEVELHKICMECINLISMQALSKNLEVELDLDPFVPQKINSDSNRIRQVLLNLLSNALKFTQDGKITIRTQLIEENLIQIDIEDTGCGIPQKNLNTIIGRFGKKDSQWANQRKDNTLNTRGAGLGLTIANNLATGLGGNRRLQVQSKENMGSKFSFCIVNHPLNKVGCNFQYKNIFSQEVIKWDYVSEYSQKQQVQQFMQMQFDSANTSNKQNNTTNGVPQSLINISIRSKKKNEESQNNLQTSKYQQPIQSLIRFNTEIMMQNTSIHNHLSHLNNIVNQKNEPSYSMISHQQSMIDGVKSKKYQLSFRDLSQYEDQGSVFENNLFPQPHQVLKSKPSDQSYSRLIYNDNLTDHMKCESQMSIRPKNDSDQYNNDPHQRYNSQFSPAHFNRSFKNYDQSFSMLTYQEIRNRQNSRGQYQQNRSNNPSFIRPNSELLPHIIQSSIQNQGSAINNTIDSKNTRSKQSLHTSDKDLHSSNDNQQRIPSKQKIQSSLYRTKEDQQSSSYDRIRKQSDVNEESCNILLNNSDIQNIQEPNFFASMKVSQKRVNDASQIISHYSHIPGLYENQNQPDDNILGVKIKFNDNQLNEMYENDIIRDKFFNKEVNFHSDSFTQIRESVEWGSMWNKTTEEIKQNDKNSISNIKDSVIEDKLESKSSKQQSPRSSDSKSKKKEQKEENIKYILDKQEIKIKLQQSADKNNVSQEIQANQSVEMNKMLQSDDNNNNAMSLPILELSKHKSSADNFNKEKLLEFNKNRKCQCPNILIVDDNEFNIITLEIRLKLYGFIIDKSMSGQLAIQQVKKKYESSQCCQFYSIIFMDIDMPIKNGYETTTEILEFYKQNKITKPPPISACTAYVQQSEKTKALQVGMKYYVTKPINQKSIEEVLISVFLNNKSSK